MLKRRRKIKIKNKKTLIIVLLIALIASYFLPDKFSASKYVLSKIKNHFFKSDEFYFESDKLREDGLEVEETNTWDGRDAYNLIISMYSKKNEDQRSSYDIDYNVNVTCTSDKVDCKLEDGKTERIIDKSDNEDAFTVIVTPKSGETFKNGESVEIEITATSTKPYQKTITGTIILTVGKGEVYYEIIDKKNSPYLDLVLINPTLESKEATIRFDTSKIVIDNTNEAYIKTVQKAVNNRFTENKVDENDGKTYEYINGFTISINSLESIPIRFYKNNKLEEYTYGNVDEIITEFSIKEKTGGNND